jgi:hypothetical protein
VRNDWADQAGGAEAIAAILDPISARLTTEVLTDLGVRHVIDLVDVPDVAAEFLAGGAADAAASAPAPAASGPAPAASPAAEAEASPAG